MCHARDEGWDASRRAVARGRLHSRDPAFGPDPSRYTRVHAVSPLLARPSPRGAPATGRVATGHVAARGLMPPILEARELTKSYRLGTTTVEALRGVSLTVNAGEFVAIMGPSGSGKSTLLQLLGGLDRPTSGEVILDGETVSRLSDTEATRLRREKTGFVFQFFNLIPLLDVYENVALPFTIAGTDPRRGEAATRIRDVLDLV